MKILKCCECSISSRRRNQVIGKGSIPADVLFLGEAPGKAEDVLGEPFVGPSGVLLAKMIVDSSVSAGLKGPPSSFFTNVILCRPYIEDKYDDNYFENREPKKEEVLKCMKNVMEIVRNVNPKIVVFVGKIAEKYYKKEFQFTARILHPSFLLRHGGTSSPYYPSTTRILQEIFLKVSK